MIIRRDAEFSGASAWHFPAGAECALEHLQPLGILLIAMTTAIVKHVESWMHIKQNDSQRWKHLHQTVVAACKEVQEVRPRLVQDQETHTHTHAHTR